MLRDGSGGRRAGSVDAGVRWLTALLVLVLSATTNAAGAAVGGEGVVVIGAVGVGKSRLVNGVVSAAGGGEHGRSDPPPARVGPWVVPAPAPGPAAAAGGREGGGGGLWATLSSFVPSREPPRPLRHLMLFIPAADEGAARCLAAHPAGGPCTWFTHDTAGRLTAAAPPRQSGMPVHCVTASLELTTTPADCGVFTYDAAARTACATDAAAGSMTRCASAEPPALPTTKLPTRYCTAGGPEELCVVDTPGSDVCADVHGTAKKMLLGMGVFNGGCGGGASASATCPADAAGTGSEAPAVVVHVSPDESCTRGLAAALDAAGAEHSASALPTPVVIHVAPARVGAPEEVLLEIRTALDTHRSQRVGTGPRSGLMSAPAAPLNAPGRDTASWLWASLFGGAPAPSPPSVSSAAPAGDTTPHAVEGSAGAPAAGARRRRRSLKTAVTADTKPVADVGTPEPSSAPSSASTPSGTEQQQAAVTGTRQNAEAMAAEAGSESVSRRVPRPSRRRLRRSRGSVGGPHATAATTEPTGNTMQPPPTDTSPDTVVSGITTAADDPLAAFQGTSASTSPASAVPAANAEPVPDAAPTPVASAQPRRRATWRTEAQPVRSSVFHWLWTIPMPWYAVPSLTAAHVLAACAGVVALGAGLAALLARQIRREMEWEARRGRRQSTLRAVSARLQSDANPRAPAGSYGAPVSANLTRVEGGLISPPGDTTPPLSPPPQGVGAAGVLSPRRTALLSPPPADSAGNSPASSAPSDRDARRASTAGSVDGVSEGAAAVILGRLRGLVSWLLGYGSGGSGQQGASLQEHAAPATRAAGTQGRVPAPTAAPATGGDLVAECMGVSRTAELLAQRFLDIGTSVPKAVDTAYEADRFVNPLEDIYAAEATAGDINVHDMPARMLCPSCGRMVRADFLKPVETQEEPSDNVLDFYEKQRLMAGGKKIFAKKKRKRGRGAGPGSDGVCVTCGFDRAKLFLNAARHLPTEFSLLAMSTREREMRRSVVEPAEVEQTEGLEEVSEEEDDDEEELALPSDEAIARLRGNRPAACVSAATEALQLRRKRNVVKLYLRRLLWALADMHDAVMIRFEDLCERLMRRVQDVLDACAAQETLSRIRPYLPDWVNEKAIPAVAITWQRVYTLVKDIYLVLRHRGKYTQEIGGKYMLAVASVVNRLTNPPDPRDVDLDPAEEYLQRLIAHHNWKKRQARLDAATNLHAPAPPAWAEGVLGSETATEISADDADLDADASVWTLTEKPPAGPKPMQVGLSALRALVRIQRLAAERGGERDSQQHSAQQSTELLPPPPAFEDFFSPPPDDDPFSLRPTFLGARKECKESTTQTSKKFIERLVDEKLIERDEKLLGAHAVAARERLRELPVNKLPPRAPMAYTYEQGLGGVLGRVQQCFLPVVDGEDDAVGGPVNLADCIADEEEGRKWAAVLGGGGLAPAEEHTAARDFGVSVPLESPAPTEPTTVDVDVLLGAAEAAVPGSVVNQVRRRRLPEKWADVGFSPEPLQSPKLLAVPGAKKGPSVHLSPASRSGDMGSRRPTNASLVSFDLTRSGDNTVTTPSFNLPGAINVDRTWGSGALPNSSQSMPADITAEPTSPVVASQVIRSTGSFLSKSFRID